MFKKTMMVLALTLTTSLATAGESYVGYDEQGNQVHVVDGRIVKTVPRSELGGTTQPVAPQPRARFRLGRRTGGSLPYGYGHGPTGAVELNPYESRKWYKDEMGMIDAINRDHPPVYPRR